MNIRDTKLQFGTLSKRNSTRYIVVHHSASTSGDAQTFHKWHKAKGWSGIGYHFVILKSGIIEQGRPIDTIGAHAVGYNSNSIGICLVGSFDKEEPTDKQLKALKELLEWLCLEYGLGKDNIKPHNYFNATSCPCFDISIVTGQIVKKEEKVTLAKPTLMFGSKGNEVKKLQTCLNKIMKCNLNVDGVFGKQTKSQLIAFQGKYMGIAEQDGIYGNKTKECMNKYI